MFIDRWLKGRRYIDNKFNVSYINRRGNKIIIITFLFHNHGMYLIERFPMVYNIK